MTIVRVDDRARIGGIKAAVEEDAEEDTECSMPVSEETLARGMAMGLDMMLSTE